MTTTTVPAEIAEALDRLEALHEEAVKIDVSLGGYQYNPDASKPEPTTYTGSRYDLKVNAPYLTTEHGKHLLAFWVEGTVNGVEVRGTASVMVSRPYDHGTDTYGEPRLTGSGYQVKRWEPYGNASDAARSTVEKVAVEHVTSLGWTVERLEAEGAVSHAKDLVRKVAYEAARATDSLARLRSDTVKALDGAVIR